MAEGTGGAGGTGGNGGDGGAGGNGDGGSGDGKGGSGDGSGSGDGKEGDGDGDGKDGDGSGNKSLAGGSEEKKDGGKSLAGGAGGDDDKDGDDVKDGDLASDKLADGSAKSEDQKKADKAALDAKNKDGKDDDKKDGAPEKYATFDLPEGMTELSTEQNTELNGLLKGMNLSQADAQKLVDFQAKIAVGTSDAALAEFTKTTGAWADETKKNFGANYQEKLGVGAKAIERFGPKGLRDMFDDTMVGNHPLMNEFLFNVGKAISEDKLVEGKAKGKELTMAQKMYPNMVKK